MLFAEKNYGGPMKIKILFLILSVYSAVASATMSQELASIAVNHLKNLGIEGVEFYMEQDTKLNQLYFSTFADGTDEFPCHVGVIVSKTNMTVNLGENDPELILSFPYSDTFLDLNKKIYKFCAD